MAVQACTLTDVSRNGDQSVLMATWAAAAAADTFAPIKAGEYVSKSVQFSGTFNSATGVLKGSNTGANFFGLNSAAGSPISMASEALSNVLESPLYYQPTFSGGGGSQALVCSLLLIRATPART